MSSSRSTVGRATELADAALDHPPGTALVCEAGRPPAVLASTTHPYGALVGLSCPVTIDAVAASHQAVLSVNGCRRDVLLGVAVTRAGPCVARFRADHDAPRTLGQLVGPLVDVGRRALGLVTPPCDRTPVDLLDAAFTERVLTVLLETDLGCRRPSWTELSSSHPLSGSLAITPAELWKRRFEVSATRWSEVRQCVISHIGFPDRELTPAIARWLDDGSLARWLLAHYPDPAQMLHDVCELVDPATALALRAAQSPVFAGPA